MLKNTENIPALIQTWIDKGDPDETPEKIYVPFVLTPAVVRIDGNKGQSLRLRYTGKGLASDRESIFWLNVLAVPPKKSQMGQTTAFSTPRFRHESNSFFARKACPSVLKWPLRN